MTLREIIYDVLEHLNAYSDDHKFSEEHIAFLIHNKRNMLLKQYMSNLKKEVPMEALQTVCLDMEPDDNCFEDIKVLKSSVKVPPTVENTGRSNIVKIYAGSRFMKTLNIVDYSRLPYLAKDPYNEKMLYVAVDPKSYLVAYNSAESHLLLNQLEIEAVFENPEEAWEYDCEVKELREQQSTLTATITTDPIPCEFWDEQYPIESSLISPLVTMITQELLIKYQIPLDNINNAEADNRFEDVRYRNRYPSQDNRR